MISGRIPAAPELPMALTRKQVENIAHLARLELEAGEIPQFQQSLSRIVDVIGELERAAATGRERPVGGLGLRERLLGGDRDEGVERRLARLDAREEGPHELDTGDLAGTQVGAELSQSFAVNHGFRGLIR